MMYLNSDGKDSGIVTKADIFRSYGVSPDISGRDRNRMWFRVIHNFQCFDCKSIRTPEIARKEGKKLFDVHHLNGQCGKKSRGYDKLESFTGLVLLCHLCHYRRPEHRTHTAEFSENIIKGHARNK